MAERSIDVRGGDIRKRDPGAEGDKEGPCLVLGQCQELLLPQVQVQCFRHGGPFPGGVTRPFAGSLGDA